MYRKVLVATDGSDSSRLAITQAAGLAALTQGTVHVVYVVDAGTSLIDAGHLDPAETCAAIRAEGQALLEHAGRILSAHGLPHRSVMLDKHDADEDVAACIRRYADAWGASLVVMGTHGRSGLRRMMLGSVAERVLHLSNWPVLLVRASDRERA
jgi:nucleotide-binding universal stress UspA family protein